MSKKAKAELPVVNRRTLSRREREERYRRWLYIGGGIVLALVVGVLLMALYQVQVVAPASPVATVNGTVIRTDTYQRYYRYRRYNLAQSLEQISAQLSQLDPNDENQTAIYSYLSQQQQQLQSQQMNLAMSVLDQLIEEELIQQEAARRGISVSAEEVQREIERYFGYNLETPTPTPTPEVTSTPEPTATASVTETPGPTTTPAPTSTPMTEEEFNRLYREAVQGIAKASGFTEQDLRQEVKVSLLRERLQEVMAAEVPTATEQIHARHILVSTREEADKVMERLRNGEKFVDLAKELSTDESTKEQGGDLGWFPRGQMVTEFEEVAFGLQPGQIQGPVETQYGFHIIKVEGREANRPIESALLEQLRSNALDKWLEEQRYSEGVKIYLSSDKIPVDTTS